MKKTFSLFILLPLYVLAQVAYPWYKYNLPQNAQPIVLRVTAVILQRADGTGNFRMSNQEENKAITGWLQLVNSDYANIQAPVNADGKCYNGPLFRSDAKVRFVFNVIEVRNTQAWNYLNSGIDPDSNYHGNYSELSPHKGWYLQKISDSLNALKTEKSVHLFFTTNGARFDEIKNKIESGDQSNFPVTLIAASQFPSAVDLKQQSGINYMNIYLKYYWHKLIVPGMLNVPLETSINWFLNGNLKHELGHTFGLYHGNEYHNDYECGDSFMSYGSGPHNYIEPTEIQKMHWSMSYTSIMQYVTVDSYYGTQETIAASTKWDTPRRYYNSFELMPNKTLTVSSTVTLSPQAYIRLNTGSKIIITKTGRLQDAYGGLFTKYRNNRVGQVVKQ